MRLSRVAAAVATFAVVSGCGVTHHGAITVARAVSSHSPAARPSPSADPSLVWLESAGGQAQVTFNNDVDALAAALEIESHSPTVANHLVFEADGRVMRAEARTILSTSALLPTIHRAEYKRMLNDFIAMADLLQPGPGYGTTAQDYSAWYTALRASNINVS